LSVNTTASTWNAVWGGVGTSLGSTLVIGVMWNISATLTTPTGFTLIETVTIEPGVQVSFFQCPNAPATTITILVFSSSVEFTVLGYEITGTVNLGYQQTATNNAVSNVCSVGPTGSPPPPPTVLAVAFCCAEGPFGSYAWKFGWGDVLDGLNVGLFTSAAILAPAVGDTASDVTLSAPCVWDMFVFTFN
jgi:hypothetical protein